MSGPQNEMTVENTPTKGTVMKTKRQFCLYGLLFAIAALSIRADKPVPPPDPKSLVGAWFGLDQNRLIFCRLELNPDGKGFCSTTYVNNPARLYVVEKWSLDGFNLNTDLTPADKDAEPIQLKGGGGPPELVLEIGGIGEKTWKRQLRLFKEQDFLAKNERVKKRIEKYKAEQSVKPKK
jgi:hypothetical protein